MLELLKDMNYEKLVEYCEKINCSCMKCNYQSYCYKVAVHEPPKYWLEADAEYFEILVKEG